MQQIQIEIARAEPGKACRASTGDGISSYPIGLHLGNQKYTIALTGNHATDKLLRAPIPVISGSIDQRHTERNARANRLLFNGRRMPSLPQVPGALTERWYSGPIRQVNIMPRGR